MFEVALIDHALFAGGLAAIGMAPAAAQQTSQTYCASLPATSCEVLNVELGGVVAPSSMYGIGIIKYCRNQNFEMAPIILGPGNLGQTAAYFAFIGQDNTTVQARSGYTPSTGASTSVTSTGLCAKLP